MATKKQQKNLKKGFAAISAERRREIAAMGGKASQKKGTAHRWDHEEAVTAGRKGGKAAQKSGKAFRWTSKTGRVAARKRGKRSA
jgi:general stress protein YciG